MSSTVLSKKTSNRAIFFKKTIKKFDAIRYLPNLIYGFISFDATGELVATTDPVITGNLKFAPSATPGALATAGAGTITAALMAIGIFTRDCAGAGRTDTTDTAVAIIAALGLTANYQERFFSIANISAGAFASTLAAGVGVTINGAIVISQGAVQRVRVIQTSGTTVALCAA